MFAPDGLITAHADSARAVAAVYTVSLLATMPLAVAAIAAFIVRHATAEARSLVWRSAIVALLLAFVGRISAHSLAWVVPSLLAAPLVSLGRIEVTGASVQALGGMDGAAAAWSSLTLVRLVLALYLVGVAAVIVPTLVASARVRRRSRSARSLRRAERACAALCAELGIRRPARVLVSVSARVPSTWGVLRPVILLPAAALEWNDSELNMVLLHELSHVRASDWAFAITARVTCALYWFHPGAWWIATHLREECELACDERVIASGVLRSDYAELLVNAAEMLRGGGFGTVTLALSQRSGLRMRLHALLDARRDARPLAHGWTVVAAASAFAVAGSMSAIQLAPSRAVLTTLMSDTRWESRAYAVQGLAQRQDTVAVAQSAAELDPNPRVRAWARYALGDRLPLSGVRAVLHD